MVVGRHHSAPMNKKMTLKEAADNREKIKRLNFLRYEALKRELLLLTVGIGTACTGYCLVTLSVQLLVFSTTLQTRGQHVTRNGSRNFHQKEDKKNWNKKRGSAGSLEKTLKGCGIALSSPRLVIPATIYGLWELSQHFTHDIFDFQLVPAMVGLFAYKAAALVQVYRDHEDLQLIFPDSDGCIRGISHITSVNSESSPSDILRLHPIASKLESERR